MSSQTGTGAIQENGWSKTYRMAARMKGPSASWATTGCREGHKRGIWSSVQWGQARAEMACRRNEGRSSGGEQRQPLYVVVNNSSPGGADLSEQRSGCLTGTAGRLAFAELRFSLACLCMHGHGAHWKACNCPRDSASPDVIGGRPAAQLPCGRPETVSREILCAPTVLQVSPGPSRRRFACLAETLEFLCGRAPSLPLHLSNKTSPWPLLLLPGFFNILRPVPPGTEQPSPHHAVTTTATHSHLPSTSLPLRTPSPLLGFFSPP
ncbi:hypothetical protein SVAN01_00222 [Stagonosporopsis vannaccii]|nr:hypothetical protein SVAN01_00222 [Stagonosporopsis vannaccii]